MKHIIISSLYILALFLLSRFVFDPTYLYYELPWLDIPMHIMGGFGVASLTGAILSYRGIKVSYIKLIIAYSVIAISWEMYEYVHDILIVREWNGWYDTIKDFYNGFVGMSIAYLFIRK